MARSTHDLDGGPAPLSLIPHAPQPTPPPPAPFSPALHDNVPPAIYYPTTPPHVITDSPDDTFRCKWCPFAAHTTRAVALHASTCHDYRHPAWHFTYDYHCPTCFTTTTTVPTSYNISHDHRPTPLRHSSTSFPHSPGPKYAPTLTRTTMQTQTNTSATQASSTPSSFPAPYAPRITTIALSTILSTTTTPTPMSPHLEPLTTHRKPCAIPLQTTTSLDPYFTRLLPQRAHNTPASGSHPRARHDADATRQHRADPTPPPAPTLGSPNHASQTIHTSIHSPFPPAGA